VSVASVDRLLVVMAKAPRAGHAKTRLAAAGFTADQAARLMFLRWLHARQGVGR